MELSDQLNAPAALPSRKVASSAHWIEGWVGFRAGLDAVVKIEVFQMQYNIKMDLKT
jgi:hypothetical protein